MYIIKITTPKSEKISYLKSIGTYSEGTIYFETTTDFKNSHDFKTLDTAQKVVSLFGTRDSEDTESYTSDVGSEYTMTICMPKMTLIDVDDINYENGKLN